MSTFKLGNIELENPIMLAPMAGVTDFSYRRICRRYGADFSVTEMVSAKGMYYNDEKTGMLAEITEDISPCAVQIFGKDPDIMAQAAEKLTSGEYRGCRSSVIPTAIDINMGCPVHKIVSNGEGSALMKNPELVGEIVKSVSKATTLPVTVKIRAGWDESSKNAVKIAEICEKNGAKMVTVHGRTRTQMYMGEADLNIIKDVKSALGIPVIGNGGIFNSEDALRMFDLTGCDGIMVGRGAEGNPFIFEEIKAVLSGKYYTPPSAEERMAAAFLHAEMLCKYKGDYIGIHEARKHMAWYLKGIRGSAKMRAACNYIESIEDLRRLLEEYKNELDKDAEV